MGQQHRPAVWHRAWRLAVIPAMAIAGLGLGVAAAPTATATATQAAPPAPSTAHGRSHGHQAAGRPASRPADAKQGAGTWRRKGGRPAGGTQQGAGQLPVTGGPVAADFVDIRTVRPNVRRPRVSPAASRGTFLSRCGRNEQGKHNSDNVIVAPGVVNGAHHTHDYVGNVSTDGLSTDASLAAAGTTCTNGDKSTHYWPVVRLTTSAVPSVGTSPEQEAQSAADGNVGQILTPATVTLKFSGNPRGKVTAMPRFLRIITGDAKATTNGGANAHAQWTCTGFENRRLTDKYPLCPAGSKVTRILDFQSCWNGVSVDSVNHRTHVAYAAADGSCPAGMRAIPALQQRITYNIPPGTLFALDSFPEQLHKPVTDHGDFINVMSNRLMRQAVWCINTGRRCG